MSLNDQEQRVLAEIERSLTAEAPRLARDLAVGAPRHVWHSNWERIGLLSTLVGWALFFTGAVLETAAVATAGAFLVTVCLLGTCALAARATPPGHEGRRPVEARQGPEAPGTRDA